MLLFWLGWLILRLPGAPFGARLAAGVVYGLVARDPDQPGTRVLGCPSRGHWRSADASASPAR
jgi:hypothetical protein